MQVPGLLQEYKGCLATRKFDEAEKINKEINSFITNEINTTGLELWRFADHLLHDQLKLRSNAARLTVYMHKAARIEESIPVYFAAASLFKKERDLVWMGLCVGSELVSCGSGVDDDEWRGMLGANMRMIIRDVTMKEVVKRHVIPLMHDIKNQMLEVTSVSEKYKYEEISRVLRYIARSEELVDDDVAAKEAWEERRVWGKGWRELVERWRELYEGSKSSEEQPGKVKRRRFTW